jgi:DNA-binding NarL/FixJ family response regulator
MASQRERTDLILTLREREVLTLIREDLGNKQIAERLQIAEATVKNHVHSLLEKLNVKRRTQAARATVPMRAELLERRRG